MPTKLDLEIPSAFALFIPSWRRSMEAVGRSPHTIRLYTDAARQFGDYLVKQGMPTELEYVSREHVESWLSDLRERTKPATVQSYYRGVRAFFKWALEEDEIRVSPMARIKSPVVPVVPPTMLSDAEIRALLKACDGRDFMHRRDEAIIRLFIDTGFRRSEVAGLKLTDVDLDRKTASVMGKGQRGRTGAFGRKTAQALDRYIRLRRLHRDAASPWLWLGGRGPLLGSGIYEMVKRRAKTAGIGHAWLHLFRHNFAHSFLAAGGQETDLMMLAGWNGREMIGRYGASAAAERAIAAAQRLALGDRF